MSTNLPTTNTWLPSSTSSSNNNKVPAPRAMPPPAPQEQPPIIQNIIKGAASHSKINGNKIFPPPASSHLTPQQLLSSPAAHSASYLSVESQQQSTTTTNPYSRGTPSSTSSFQQQQAKKIYGRTPSPNSISSKKTSMLKSSIHTTNNSTTTTASPDDYTNNIHHLSHHHHHHQNYYSTNKNSSFLSAATNASSVSNNIGVVGQSTSFRSNDASSSCSLTSPRELACEDAKHREEKKHSQKQSDILQEEIQGIQLELHRFEASQEELYHCQNFMAAELSLHDELKQERDEKKLKFQKLRRQVSVAAAQRDAAMDCMVELQEEVKRKKSEIEKKKIKIVECEHWMQKFLEKELIMSMRQQQPAIELYEKDDDDDDVSVPTAKNLHYQKNQEGVEEGDRNTKTNAKKTQLQLEEDTLVLILEQHQTRLHNATYKYNQLSKEKENLAEKDGLLSSSETKLWELNNLIEEWKSSNEEIMGQLEMQAKEMDLLEAEAVGLAEWNEEKIQHLMAKHLTGLKELVGVIGGKTV